MAEKLAKEGLSQLVLNAVALGMGICAMTSSILGVVQTSVDVTLGAGLACLGLAGLERMK